MLSEKNHFTVFLLIGFMVTCSVACQKHKVSMKILEPRSILYLDSLSPKIDVESYIFPKNPICINKKGNIYFNDKKNHRILVYDVDGNFIQQIGGIGQGLSDLYNPLGLFLYKNSIYVLNKAGKEIKIFSHDGECENVFKINNVWLADSIAVSDESIFIGARYWDINKVGHKLISVFDCGGNKKREIGRIIDCPVPSGYLYFNIVFLAVKKNKIYGAFENRPIIFCYKPDGEEIFVRDLSNAGIEEIDFISERERQEGFDTPETTSSNRQLRILQYCWGFIVDDSSKLYYLVNIYNLEGGRPSQSVILVFNSKGILLEKIKLAKDGYPVQVRWLLVSTKNERYALGKFKKKTILFKF